MHNRKSIWLARWTDAFGRDLTYGLHSLRSRPGFTFTAIASLALGIGANSAIFSIIDGMFFHPPAIYRPSELVRVFSTARDGSEIVASLDDYTDIAQQCKSLSGLVAAKDMFVTLRHNGQSQFVNALIVSENYLSVLKPPFVQGRPFAPSDYEPAGPWPASISHAFWQKQFEGSPDVVGKTVLLENHSFIILGVLSKDFRGIDGYGAADVYLPLQAWKIIDSTNTDYMYRDARVLTLYGRLNPSYSVTQVQSELSLIAAKLARAYPKTNEGIGARVIRDFQYRVKSAGTFPLILFGAITLILLMSCVNVANLLLAQADRRRREFAVRQAMGAARSRLIGQMLTESLLLSFLGSLFGLLLAYALIEYVPLFQSSFEGYVPVFRIDHRVIAFSMLLVLVTSVLFGLFPALQSSRPGLFPELRGSLSSRSAGRLKLRVRSVPVVAQLAVTMILLAGTGLMLKTLGNLITTDLGFPRKDILSMFVHTGTRSPAVTATIFEQWAERVKNIPGVKEVSMARRMPIRPSVGATWASLYIPTASLPQDQKTFSTSYNCIGLNFFTTMGIRILRGRDFNRSDTVRSPHVMIINETMAERFWPNRDPLGSQVLIGGPDGSPATVVGVAGNTKVDYIEQSAMPYFYVPYTQDFRPFINLLAETRGEPMQLVKPIRAELAALDPQLPSGLVMTLKQALRIQSGSKASIGVLIGLLGIVAMTLAIVGLYGMIAFAANQRTREIGIRMALGAQVRDVVWLVLRQGMVVVLLGVGLGLLASKSTTHLLTDLLFGVTPMDFTVLLGGSLFLSAVATLACYIPARRAARIDPVMTLRAE
jgi:predicted permease